jgi:hypothetical protein
MLEESSGGSQGRFVRGGGGFGCRHDLGRVPFRKADRASRFRHLRLGEHRVFVCCNVCLRLILATPPFSSILPADCSTSIPLREPSQVGWHALPQTHCLLARRQKVMVRFIVRLGIRNRSASEQVAHRWDSGWATAAPHRISADHVFPTCPHAIWRPETITQGRFSPAKNGHPWVRMDPCSKKLLRRRLCAAADRVFGNQSIEEARLGSQPGEFASCFPT